ncbi:PREDICTED: uncharacterized protein LOC109470757 [Branchiostoma belcheri]|uniref:Uncharacterized protein LOC109470757 n=1 Tax=Branchiostoma belcheri TaxID=7741 RepID=A0A6P4Z6Y8_BRABE|nr:PREDICTED: uncharacterized protein LOC109470757 [Branchiostoma belcheri]XP_019625386.1 PREDICTED: uncharacterized protein LOC109470757 [Branchiostoma belcheri]
MSLRTRINGFTAWVNLRLVSYSLSISNILNELLTGSHLKMLVQSFTGMQMKKLQSMDGLTETQKLTRVEWAVTALKKSQVIEEEARIDCRLVTMRSADHVFDLMWHLIAYDIWFLWERADYLQQEDLKVLTQVPYKWTPEPPPLKKKPKRKMKTDLLAGFGAKASVADGPEELGEDQSQHDRYPGTEVALSYKKNLPRGGWLSYPSPDDCILDLVCAQLARVREGSKLTVECLDDIADSRVLCALINSFVPGTFTTEVLLNDRWTLNLALQTIGAMTYCSVPMTSQDLVEADPKALSAFMCFFFMSCFKFRQSRAVKARVHELHLLMQEVGAELDTLPDVAGNMAELRHKKELKSMHDAYREELEELQQNYDIKFCEDWVEHVADIQLQTHKQVASKMKERYEVLTVPRSITINEMCITLLINLSLTQGAGFYRMDSKEIVTADRRLVLFLHKTGQYVDDQVKASSGVSVRSRLGLQDDQPQEINPALYPQYQIFVGESVTKQAAENWKCLLYQVFPCSTLQWQRMMMKAGKEGDDEMMNKLVSFFRVSHPSFINSQEASTGNSVLHVASRAGHFNIVRYLLKNGANVNLRNASGGTPLFSAAEGLHRRVAQLLLEWGADVNAKNFRCMTALEGLRSDELKDNLTAVTSYLTSIVPKIMEGDMQTLKRVVQDHVMGVHHFADLSSRCISGSTLLHTAAYFGATSVAKELLKERIDVNLSDYKGATPLHRARDKATIQLLLDSGAGINARDYEGNTPLHILCYGEKGQPSQLDCLQALLDSGAHITLCNKKGLLAAHCCAMQGRTETIQLLVDRDVDGAMRAAIEEGTNLPSLTYLAVVNGFLACAMWLVQANFALKAGEADQLLQIVLMKRDMEDAAMFVQFLLDNQADVGVRFAQGNTPLHLAAASVTAVESLQLLLSYGAEVDATNDLQETPLFNAVQANNHYAASILINHGVNVRCVNLVGLTAFDQIQDFDEWLECSFFSDEIKARMKAFSLKHARDLVRAITKKVKTAAPLSSARLPGLNTSAHWEKSRVEAATPTSSHRIQTAPPLSRAPGTGRSISTQMFQRRAISAMSYTGHSQSQTASTSGL